MAWKNVHRQPLQCRYRCHMHPTFQNNSCQYDQAQLLANHNTCHLDRWRLRIRNSTSHHITSHHITSHHITSHHIISYHFTFQGIAPKSSSRNTLTKAAIWITIPKSGAEWQRDGSMNVTARARPQLPASAHRTIAKASPCTHRVATSTVNVTLQHDKVIWYVSF